MNDICIIYLFYFMNHNFNSDYINNRQYNNVVLDKTKVKIAILP